MDRFVIKEDFNLLTNCDLCSRKVDCESYLCTDLCVLELLERLYKYESEAEELELKVEKLKSHPVLGKFFN